MYHLSRDKNGTEDEIRIHAPDGRIMASIFFWDESEQAEADARLIVEALNQQISA